jgi:hypothetical protein
MRMFDTLIVYAVAYYHAHPDALARYRTSKTHEEFVDEAYQFTRWSLITPPWNSPEMQQRLDEESHELSRAPQVAQARFFAAKNAAIVQLEYGEHE